MKVDVVFKTHVDIGFTDLPFNVLKNYAFHMLKEAIDVCESTGNRPAGERFVWTLPAYPLYRALKETSPELRARAEKLIENNQLVWHALPFTLRTDFFTKDELEWGLRYAKFLSETYHKPMPVSAKMTDVPGHCQSLVDVLAENGIKFLHLASNPACTCPDVPTMFWWESKKENRILTYFQRTYGSEQYGTCMETPPDWNYDSHLVLMQSNDNRGVQSADIIDRLKEEAVEIYGGELAIHVGTIDDFYYDISKNDLSDLPVIHGELGNTWIQQLGSFPKSCATVKETRGVYQPILDFLRSKKDCSFDSQILDMMEGILLFGEHSGGVDTKKYLKNLYYNRAELDKAIQTSEYQYAMQGWSQELGFAELGLQNAKKLKEAVEKKYLVSFDTGRSVTRLPISEAEYKFTDNGVQIFNHIDVAYKYRIIGKGDINTFLDRYLTHQYDWARADFGKREYPDIPSKEWGAVRDENNALVSDKESYTVYGNAKNIEMDVYAEKDGVVVKVTLLEKQPTLYAESGYVEFDINEVLDDYCVERGGVEVYPTRDIVKGANFGLQAVCSYVKANDYVIEPLDSCLVSFGKDKVFCSECECLLPVQNGKICFNVFNNMFGTGSPQWLDGNYSFSFRIKPLPEKAIRSLK